MIRQVFVIFTLVAIAFGSPVPDEFLDREGRIVGGSNAPLGRFPFMAALQTSGGQHFCGGSIITNRWVLSAAHCTIGRTTTNTRVVVGTVMRSGAGGVNHALSRIVNHASYGTPLAGSDISVVQTTATISFNTNVQAISMGSSFIGGGVTATIIGFGRLTTGGDSPTQLQQLSTRTITSAQCQVIDIILCTQLPAGQGTCNGDSGSPLFVTGSQIGIAAWIRGECGDGRADGFTRMSSFRSWVLNTIG